MKYSSQALSEICSAQVHIDSKLLEISDYLEAGGVLPECEVVFRGGRLFFEDDADSVIASHRWQMPSMTFWNMWFRWPPLMRRTCAELWRIDRREPTRSKAILAFCRHLRILIPLV